MPNQQHVSSALDRLMAETKRNCDLRDLLQSTARTLANLDFEHQHEMRRLENSRTDPALKKQIAENLRLRHRERRQPYIMLIAELQRHLSPAALSDLQATG